MFEIEDLKGELLVTYTVHIDSVELVIGSEGIDITRRLSLDQQFDIIDALS